MRFHGLTMLAAIMALLCSACSNGQQGVPTEVESPHGRTTASGLEILPGGLFESLQEDSLDVAWSTEDGRAIATISTSAATDLRAAYLRLELPEAVDGNVSLIPGEWAGEDALSIAVPSSDNTVDIGICMLHPGTAEGYSGSGTLATISFDGRTPALVRSASTPPLSSGSRIDLDYDPSRNFFYWYYRNQGDYDQNGEVNVSDLTPIAVHFGKTATGGFPVASVESVVDGDGNGEINIADISPIGIGFGSRVDSFNIYKGTPGDYPAAPTDPSSIPELQAAALGDALNTPAGGRLYYEIINQEAADGAAAYWLRPVDSGSEGIPSELSGLGNQAPTASFTLEKTAGVDPLQLKADASASSDPEGGELEYYWFIEQGFFQAQLTDPGKATLTQQVGPGNWSLALFVRDEDGATGFASQQFSVTAQAGWQVVDLDIVASGNPVVEIEDIALKGIDGRPYISTVYESTDRTVVTLNYGNDPLWNQLLETRRINEMPGGSSGQVDILDVGGVPGVVSLQKKPTESRVEYNYVEDQVFTSPYNIALSNNNLRDISAVMVEDRPSVVIFDRSNGDLLQAVSDDATGSHWGTAQVFINGNNTGWGVCAALIGGSPAIFFYDGDTGDMRYADSQINAGSVAWNAHVSVYNGNYSEIGDAVLDLPGGGPWLLLHDYNGNGLVSLRDSGFATKIQVSPTGGDSHTEYSTAVVGDRVCYAFADDGMLKFRRSTDETALSWLPAENIAPITLEDGWVSLADVGGFPAVAWVEDTTATAHYAVLVE